MKSYIIKILIITLTILLSYNMVFCSYAADGILQQAKDFMELGEDDQGLDVKSDIWSELAGILWGAGIWVSVLSGMAIGIKFMLSTPDQRAELKNSAKVWLIGSIVIIGALTIWRTAIEILDIF